MKLTIWAIYLTCFYAVVEMMIGQEHIQPISDPEKVFSSLITLLGALVVAFVFGQVAVNISNYYANSNNYRKKMEFGSYHCFGGMPIAEVSVLLEFPCAP